MIRRSSRLSSRLSEHTKKVEEAAGPAGDVSSFRKQTLTRRKQAKGTGARGAAGAGTVPLTSTLTDKLTAAADKEQSDSPAASAPVVAVTPEPIRAVVDPADMPADADAGADGMPAGSAGIESAPTSTFSVSVVAPAAVAAASAASAMAARVQHLEAQLAAMAQQVAAGQQCEADLQAANDRVLHQSWAAEEQVRQLKHECDQLKQECDQLKQDFQQKLHAEQRSREALREAMNTAMEGESTARATAEKAMMDKAAAEEAAAAREADMRAAMQAAMQGAVQEAAQVAAAAAETEADLRRQVEEQTAAIAHLMHEVDDLKRQGALLASAMVNQLQGLEARFQEELKSETAAAKSAVDAAEQRAAAAKAELATAENRAVVAEQRTVDEVASAKAKLAAAEHRAAGAEQRASFRAADELAAVKAKLAAAEQRAAVAEHRAASAEAVIEHLQQLEAALHTLQDRAAGIEQRAVASEERAAAAEQRAAAADAARSAAIDDCKRWEAYSSGLEKNLTVVRNEVARLSAELDSAKDALQTATARAEQVRKEAQEHTKRMNAEMAQYKRAADKATADQTARVTALATEVTTLRGKMQEADTVLMRTKADAQAAHSKTQAALVALEARNRALEEETRAHGMAVKKAQAAAEASRHAAEAAAKEKEEAERVARAAERMGLDKGRAEGRQTTLSFMLTSIKTVVAGTPEQALFERTPLPDLLTKMRTTPAAPTVGTAPKKP